MSNIWEGIYDDADKYLALCRKFKETPLYVNGFPNSYGDHAYKLKQMAEKESESRLEEKFLNGN